MGLSVSAPSHAGRTISQTIANDSELGIPANAGSTELADYLTTKRIEFSYSTGNSGNNINDRRDRHYHGGHFYGDMLVAGFHCSFLLQAF